MDSQFRNSQMELGSVYFWTDTVKDWRHVFRDKNYIRIVLSSLKNLVERGKVRVYGFVIMPNHLHLIWEMLNLNGKEFPSASFNKFTSHVIIKGISCSDPNALKAFRVGEGDRNFRLWQRDPLAILLDTREKLEQKLNYMHLNPLQSHWNLAKDPVDYQWSSARFYEEGVDEFGFFTHYMDRF